MYKAFVSSTFADLLEHRSEAIRTIQATGIHVDPMENWQADRDAPDAFSAARLAHCDLCILLVAFRRGTVPAGQTRSIVQIEYEEARRRGIDVLPFLLRDDAAVGPDGWPASFDERTTDPAIVAWRAQIRQSHGVGEFGVLPKSLRIEAALARWVVQRVTDRNRRWRNAGLAALGATLLATTMVAAMAAYVYTTPSERSAWHGRFLAYHDPAVFNSAEDGRYQIARVLADRNALTRNTKFGQELAATQESLDVLINNAQYVRTSQAETFRALIRRGVRVRFILLDYTAAGDSFDAFHRATGISVPGTREGSREMHAYLLQLREEIAARPQEYRGSMEFRWNARPLLYTMWIRDWRAGGNASALGHLSVHFYRGETHWPVFRTSPVDGRDLIDNMHAEFETAWAASSPTLQNPRLQ